MRVSTPALWVLVTEAGGSGVEANTPTAGIPSRWDGGGFTPDPSHFDRGAQHLLLCLGSGAKPQPLPALSCSAGRGKINSPCLS